MENNGNRLLNKTKDIETMPINQELLNLIAPQGIEIKSSRVQMGEFLSKIQYVSGYPSRVNIGWLLNLKDIPNTIVSLVITPIEDVQAFVEGVSNLFSEQNALCYTLCCTNIEEEYRGLLDVVSRGFAGAILHDLAEGVALIELYNRLCRKLPLVIVHSFPADLDCNSITVNQEKGMKDAMAYLLGLGHRKIAYVAGEAGYSFKLKEKIWQEELEKIGLPPQKQDSIKAANTDFISGIDTSRREVLKYFENGNRPTAIFTANDIMALGTLAALNELGLRVPDDISLMSHDNTMFAKTYNLTCIDMKIKSVGIAAVDLLEYAVHGSDSTPRHITISPELVIRTSCKAI